MIDCRFGVPFYNFNDLISKRRDEGSGFISL